MNSFRVFAGACLGSLLMLGVVRAEEFLLAGEIQEISSRHRTIQLEGETYRIAASIKATEHGKRIKDVFQLAPGQPVAVTWVNVGENRMIKTLEVVDQLP